MDETPMQQFERGCARGRESLTKGRLETAWDGWFTALAGKAILENMGQKIGFPHRNQFIKLQHDIGRAFLAEAESMSSGGTYPNYHACRKFDTAQYMLKGNAYVSGKTKEEIVSLGTKLGFQLG